VLGLLALFSVRQFLAKAVVLVATVALLTGFFTLEAKLWGVVLMGLTLMLFFFLPWLDRSPVKSIRYRGWMYKLALVIFVVSFLALGYVGTKPASGLYKLIAQIGTILYFAFFLFMPWYTTYDKTKPVPERVTWK